MLWARREDEGPTWSHLVNCPLTQAGYFRASRHECGSIEGSRAAVPSSGRRCSIGFERSATSRARMCLPRSLPTSSPRRRGQRGARAAQRARTTLTLTSGDARSAARKALAGQHARRRAIGAQPNCLDPLRNRRKTGTNHSPAAPAQNLCLRRRNPSSNPFGDPHSCRKTLFSPESSRHFGRHLALTRAGPASSAAGPVVIESGSH